MTATKAEFIGGPLDGRIFWTRGDPIWEMPEPPQAEVVFEETATPTARKCRTMIYRASNMLSNGRIAYRWDGYREDGDPTMRLLG